MSKDSLFNLADVYYGKSPNGFRSESETEYKMYGTGGVVGFATKGLFASNGVVIPRKGSLNNPSYATGEYWVIDTAYAAIPREGIDSKWLYYQLVNFDLSSLNEATGVPSISRDWLYKAEFFKTSYEEQQRIVEILSLMDNHIEGVNKLIEKKKNVKKGIILDLISSKNHDTFIGDIADILDNLRIPINDEERQKRGGDVPYYGANGLQGFIDKPLFNEPLILIAEDGGNFEQFAERPIAYRISGPSWVNNHAHILRARDYNQDYLFYALEHMNILNLISGGTRAKLNQGELKKIKVPSTNIKEQKRVSDLINLVVDELSSLLMLKEKLITQKQGLMQDLLTGQVKVS